MDQLLQQVADQMVDMFKRLTRPIQHGHIINVKEKDCTVYKVNGSKSISSELFITDRLLEQGGHSTLYKLNDPKYVAKMVTNGSINESNVNCLLLRFPFIPLIYEIYRTKTGGLLLLLERLEGVQLYSFLFNSHNPNLKQHLIDTTVQYIQEMNKHVIHGDAHMNNVLYNPVKQSIHIIDFGLSFVVEDDGALLTKLYTIFYNLKHTEGTLFNTLGPPLRPDQGRRGVEQEDDTVLLYNTSGVTTMDGTYMIKKSYVTNISRLVRVARICLDTFNFLIPTIPVLFNDNPPIKGIDPYPILFHLGEKINFREDRPQSEDPNTMMTELIQLLCYVKYFHELFMVSFNHKMFPDPLPEDPLDKIVPINFDYAPQVQVEMVEEDIDYHPIDYDLVTTHAERTTGGGIHGDNLPCLRGLNTDFKNQTPKELFLFQLATYLDNDYKFINDDYIRKNRRAGELFCDVILKFNPKYIHYKNPILLMIGILTTTSQNTFDEKVYKEIAEKLTDNDSKATRVNIFRYHRLFLQLQGM